MTVLPVFGIEHPQRQRTRIQPVAIGMVLVAMTLWLYAPSYSYDFVNWDDPWYILQNPLIQSWSFSNLKAIATESVIRNYAPVTLFSFLVEYTLWGDWAGGYHVVNVGLHALNAVLVFLLLKQLTGKTWLAGVTAACFAVHPVHVESVVWVSSRKGVLSGAFILGSLLCWLRKDRELKQETWGTFWLLLALLSKAIAIVVPGIVLCYDLFVRRLKFWEAITRQMIPGLLSAWLLLTTMSAQVMMLGGVRSHFGLSKLQIFAIDQVILWRYVGMLLCPKNLCVLYDPPTTGIWFAAFLASCGWALCGVWVWQKRGKQPLVLLTFVSWFLLLLPVLNFFPITTLMNDRYLYLPSIPALALVVATFGTVLERCAKLGKSHLAWATGGVMALLVVCGFVSETRQYLPVWRNDLALWEHAIEHVPQLPVVQIQRALSLHHVGEIDLAMASLETALASGNADDLDRQRMEKKLQQWRSGH